MLKHTIASFVIGIFISSLALAANAPLVAIAPMSERIENINHQKCGDGTTEPTVPVDFIGISDSCKESFMTSWNSIPQNIRACVESSQLRIGFQKVTSTYMQNQTYSSWTTGVPTMSCGGHTIITSENQCSRYDDNLTHEIGHAIHDIVREKYPVIYKDWETLWTSIHKKNGGQSFGKNPNLVLSNYLSWKDSEDAFEGFAELVKYLARPELLINPTPDTLRKINFGKSILCVPPIESPTPKSN